ncbi:MAG: twin-arginine translocation signal domain-containing protein [Bryobacteraceae bacterium]
MDMINRRRFIRDTAAASAALMSGAGLHSETPDFNALQAEIEKHHDQNVQRIQEWIHQPSIAAENRGMTEGCDLMMRLLRDAAF